MRNNNRKWSDRGLRQWEAKSRRVEARLWLSPGGEHLLNVSEVFPLGSRIPPGPLHLNCPGKKGKLRFGAVSPRNREPNYTPSLIHHSRESLALMHRAVSSVCRFSIGCTACVPERLRVPAKCAGLWLCLCCCLPPSCEGGQSLVLHLAKGWPLSSRTHSWGKGRKTPN